MDMRWQGAQLEVMEHSQHATRPPGWCEEEIGYLNRGSEQIYCVRHHPSIPRIGQVLLAGCFAFSRERVYISWVRWARFLARHGLEVLRFDYRGSGESTGNVMQMDLDAWLEDTRCCAIWLRERGDGCPMLLHGLELGALLTSRAFGQEIGEALLLWSPPATARDIFRQALQMHRVQQYAIRRQSASAGGEDCVAALEAGRPVVVGACTLSSRLWKQSAAFVLDDPQPAIESTGQHCGRPRRAVDLDATAGPLCMSGVTSRAGPADAGQLNPDLTALFHENLDWIRQSLIGNGRARATHRTD